MQDLQTDLRLDKTKIAVVSSFDNSDEKEYWLSRTPEERIAHIEYLRHINYGAEAAKRLQRILEVVKCEQR